MHNSRFEYWFISRRESENFFWIYQATGSKIGEILRAQEMHSHFCRMKRALLLKKYVTIGELVLSFDFWMRFRTSYSATENESGIIPLQTLRRKSPFLCFANFIFKTERKTILQRNVNACRFLRQNPRYSMAVETFRALRRLSFGIKRRENFQKNSGTMRLFSCQFETGSFSQCSGYTAVQPYY